MNATSEMICILHVDDEADYVEMASEFLERQDSQNKALTGTNASEVLDELPETDIHRIASNFDMPGQNWLER